MNFYFSLYLFLNVAAKFIAYTYLNWMYENVKKYTALIKYWFSDTSMCVLSIFRQTEPLHLN